MSVIACSESRGAHPVRDVLYLAGPTASGKSDVALWLAPRMEAEIISVDSMQVYRGLDVGTAKPSAQERALVRHHLIDVSNLDEPFDAARFVRLAGEAIDDIRRRGRVALLCGGTGLYFKAWMEGLGAAPAGDPVLRAVLESQPLESLLCELKEKDPVTFERIDRMNPRRVVRAVEVLRLTGRPFSDQRSDWAGKAAAPRPDFLWLDRDRSDLQRRVEMRVDRMLRSGWVEETRRAMASGLGRNPVALQAIGYRLLAEHLDGARDLESTAERIRIETRQFAKRQGTWFRKQASSVRLAVAAGDSIESVGRRVLAHWEGFLSSMPSD